MSEANISEYFGGRAARYDTAYEARDADGHALRARMAAVLRVLGRGPGSVLDAGMGPGRLASALDRRGWTVFGVDSAEEMVELTRERLPAAVERLRVAPIDSLPFADETFDAVVATGVLEYAGPDRALPELVRVLRPGGRAVVSYPNPRALYGIWKTRLYYPAARTAKRALRRGSLAFPRGAETIAPAPFEALLDHCGLDLEARLYTSYLPTITPLDMLLPRLTARLGERLEGSGDGVGRLLATQVVFATRKR